MTESTLLHAEWLERAETHHILSVLDGEQRRTRVVGGMVRDTIMGHQRSNPDLDLATELLPQDVIARAERAGIAHYPTGIAHGTVTLKIGDTLAEVTTLRQDVETDGRHAVVVFGTDWLADASRRDFTINALYCGWDGALFDPLGGLGDAAAGRVRFIGDPGRRIAEDGLRVYRFFRFTASHGGEQFDGEGLAACRSAAHRLEHLSRERVGAECMRMLALPRVAHTIGLMTHIGLLAVPDKALEALLRYEELGGASAMSRLALIGGDDLAIMQGDWRLSGEVIRLAQGIKAAAALITTGRVAEAAYRYGELAVEGLALAGALQGWRRDLLAELARELGRMRIPPFPVNGRDLTGLGLKPGPALGSELARLERVWIESDFTLGRDNLLALVER